LNIDNFVASFNFDIIMIREKVSLFLTYVEFFHKLHTKYLKRFSHKIQLMYTHVNNDIRFDDYTEMNRKGGGSLENLSQSEDSSDVESARMNTPCNSVCSDMVGDVDIRRNSFLGFCGKNNIDFDVDCIQHDKIFDVIQTKCETILNNEKGLEENKRQEEAQRIEDATRLEEETKRLEETKRIEDATRLEEETKRLEETKRVEDATRLEEETKQLEESKRVEEETNAVEEQKHLHVEEAKESTTNQQPEDISQGM
jgi:hypothetical protein